MRNFSFYWLPQKVFYRWPIDERLKISGLEKVHVLVLTIRKAGPQVKAKAAILVWKVTLQDGLSDGSKETVAYTRLTGHYPF